MHGVPKRSHNVKAMTLVEIMIVMAIVSFLAAALYHALAGGIRVWRRANEIVVEEDALVFFEKFSRDLNNVFLFSKFDINGTELSFSFPAIVQVIGDKNNPDTAGDIIRQLGRVEYYFDLNKRALMRRQANYSQALQNNFEEPLALIQNVKELQFKYHYDSDSGENVSSAAFGALPVGLEVKLGIEGPKGVKILERYFSLPLGN